MKTTDFARHLTDFLGRYLTSECGYSANTVKTYSYTFTLFIGYMETEELVRPENLTLAEITKERIIHFLAWLQKERKCSTSTRNARLGAIHSFFAYLQYRNVEGLAKWQDILSIKCKKTSSPEMAYLQIEALKLLLRQPDLKTAKGRRDFVMLGLLYDSGCRVQELLDLTPSDLRFDETSSVKLHGKGGKARIVPLSATQVTNLKLYMEEKHLYRPENQCHPLFPNPQGSKMSRMAVLNIVKKYIAKARTVYPDLFPDNIGCHSFRHSKAMHMLEADINLVYIRDFLGHSSTTTTEVYARASERMKQRALSKLNPGIVQEGKTSWQDNKNLLGYLKSLQTKY
ncbi:tyrosine-type recombinase/integrase [Bacteroides gallinarum]|mgnify:CR=1 FL=1|nr:tyrosine-type recombinase/integrase [Bacteroides gallinarum]